MAAVYRVGRSDFFSPGDLQADAETLNRQILTTDNLLEDDHAVPTAEFDAWNGFYAEWLHFFKDHFVGYFDTLLSSLNDSNRDQLVAMEERFEAFMTTFEGYGFGLPEGSRTKPSSGSGDSLDNHIKGLGLPSLGTVGIVAGIIVSGIVIWKVVK